MRDMKTGKEDVRPEKLIFATTPHWSVDGKTMTVRTIERGVTKYAQIDVATGLVQKVSRLDAATGTEKEYLSGRAPVPAGARAVTISPDDNWLAFVSASSSGSG